MTCQRRWAVLDPPPRSPCAAEAHLAVAHAPAHSLHAHLPALCARSRGEQHKVCPGRPGHRDLEGGAETHSRPLKGKGSASEAHAGPSKTSSATNAPGAGTWGPGTRGQPAPPAPTAACSRLRPRLSLPLTPRSSRASALPAPGSGLGPRQPRPGGRGQTSQRHIQPEEGPPPPRVCLSGTERCLPGSPAVRCADGRPALPSLRGSANPTRTSPAPRCFPKPRHAAGTASPCPPSPRACIDLQRATRAFQGYSSPHATLLLEDQP